ncbi:MAG: LuxR C-terminal-related transcriptional regulator [Candidatus Zapsychrus exili]|nr:LuxR C-terminal-related transcriptional regulator [Candidatus Zapsychrus exili]
MCAEKINSTEISALQLLQDINSGLINPKTIDKQSRQQCIESLVAEGYTYQQISQILKCSEKTVSRDIKEIRTRNELIPSVEFAKQFIGEVFHKAMSHHGFLVRTARAKDASSAEKIQAEYAAWKVLKELMEKFQSLGYLPSKPTEVIGNFYHHTDNDENNSPEAMRKMLLSIEEAAKDAGVLDKEVIAKIELLKARIAQSEIVVDIKQLEGKTLKENEKNHEEGHK